MMRWMIIAIGMLAAAPAAAQVTFDAPFTDHAVLQRDRAIAVHGHAAPKAEIVLSFAGATVRAVADANGAWRAILPAKPAGGPYSLVAASGGASATLGDVMVGDVWLCSGQSNMEFTLRHVTNADTEVQQSAHPLLRLFNVPRQSSATPQAGFGAPVGWQISAPASAADFSAACYFMGRDLQQRQGIAVGLISSAWGGSVIEDWISRESLATLPRYRPALDLLALYGRDPAAASLQWHSMVEKWLGARVSAPANAAWRPAPSTAAWENWGDPELASFDGIGYYRAHVTLTAAQAGKAELAIGAVDDIDLTRVNGTTVGALQGWDTQRRYPVAPGLLHAGDNVIEVAAIDTGGGGGLWGDPPRTLTLADGTVLPLKDWQFARGDALAAIGMPPGLPWLGGSGRTTLYNGMIAPLDGYPLKGFAWYQGEANVADAAGYAELMPLLIADWRKRFGADPFLMAQLAGFGPLTSQPVDDVWAQLRDVQRRVADADPKVGLASALDIGQVADIHPTNKQGVGYRLALGARAIALGEKVEARGPAPVAVVRRDGKIAIRFAHGPLVTVGGGQVIGFELCDSGGQCRYADAVASGDTVLVPDDGKASEVRYLWQASPIVNLYNPDGLPATGFRLPIGR
jgi:sialate O-acetylesterase